MIRLIPLRDLCLEYLSDAERSPPEQMQLTPQLERILRDDCDALVYTVDPALLATASAAAEAHAEFWAVLRAAMPDVYAAGTLELAASSAVGFCSALTAGGRQHKRVLVLSLRYSESSDDTDAGESTRRPAVQQGIGVLQLARLLDVARVRTPWAIVQCRWTPTLTASSSSSLVSIRCTAPSRGSRAPLLPKRVCERTSAERHESGIVKRLTCNCLFVTESPKT